MISRGIQGDRDRLVGTEAEGHDSGDYTFHLINIVLDSGDKYAAIIDTGCAGSDYIPSAEMKLPPNIPYFAAQSLTDEIVTFGLQKRTSSCTVTLGEKVLRFDWKKKNESMKEISQNGIGDRLRKKLRQQNESDI